MNLELKNIEQIDLSLAAIQRVIDNKPKLACDDTILIGIKSILEGIKREVYYN